jgi:hypothetical protein
LLDSLNSTESETEGITETRMDVASLADLLHETAEHHGSFEKAAPTHDWWD